MWRVHRIPQVKKGARHSEGGGERVDPHPLLHHSIYLCTMEGMEGSMEEGADLQYFTPSRAHMSLREVYGELLYHNNGMHLTGQVSDNSVWKSRWYRLSVQSSGCYFIPPGNVG